MDSLSALRIDLARRSKWNIGYLVAGRFSVLPAFVAALYLITFLLVPARRQRWLLRSAPSRSIS